MKKLGKKFHLTNETLRAYCGCACTTPCSTKCTCSPTGTVTSNLYNTNVSNVYTNIGVAAK